MSLFYVAILHRHGCSKIDQRTIASLRCKNKMVAIWLSGVRSVLSQRSDTNRLRSADPMETERASPRYSDIDLWEPGDVLDALIESQLAAVAAVRPVLGAIEAGGGGHRGAPAPRRTLDLCRRRHLGTARGARRRRAHSDVQLAVRAASAADGRRRGSPAPLDRRRRGRGRAGREAGAASPHWRNRCADRASPPAARRRSRCHASGAPKRTAH